MALGALAGDILDPKQPALEATDRHTAPSHRHPGRNQLEQGAKASQRNRDEPPDQGQPRPLESRGAGHLSELAATSVEQQ